MKQISQLTPRILLLSIIIVFGCESGPEPGPKPTEVFPLSDASNLGAWVLNEEVSDEFSDTDLNTEKWLIQGTDGEYKSNFIGRAPSQFSTDNVRLEDGKLMLETRWEPDFPFSSKVDEYANGTSYKFENITTAAVISKKYFFYGYMEIKCKAADASITSSFWTTGPQVELDIFEFVGAPAQDHKKFLEKEYKFTIHDWSPAGGGKSIWSDKHELAWRVADDFHTYGCEWDPNYLKFYADGDLIKTVTKAEMGEEWIMDKPLWVWVDSETFPWHGLPLEQDLPVDYEIEYIRVWQKQ